MTNQRFFPLFDSHAHLNLEDFQNDLDDILTRSRQGRLPAVRGRSVESPGARPFLVGAVCPAVDLATSLAALELATRREYLFAALGAHPNHVSALVEGEWDEIKALVERETRVESSKRRVVALGETGLDRYHDDAPFDLQLKYFVETLELAERYRLPVIIHSRDSNDDLDGVLRDFYGEGSAPNARRGVVHSFSGSIEQCERWLDWGFYLGFGGFVTYTNAKFASIWEAARRVPADRMLLETDCPFLTPSPLRGKIERNEPITTVFVAKRLAELRGSTVAEIASTTCANASTLFNLPPLAFEPDEEAAD